MKPVVPVLRPDIKSVHRFNDLEKPTSIRVSDVYSAIADNTISPDRLRYDALFYHGVDWGLVGLSDVSSDIWQSKGFDGGEL